jgi:hypothetical protein
LSPQNKYVIGDGTKPQERLAIAGAIRFRGIRDPLINFNFHGETLSDYGLMKQPII